MLCNYSDILERVSETPKWWDESGCPRYCDFSPQNVANIYAKQVALVLIKCQFCLKPFHVSFSYDSTNFIHKQSDLKTQIQDGTLHYGDPPNTDCCAGTTANCLDIRVLEFWEREKFEWIRNEEFEQQLPDGLEFDSNN